jgi:hypothetical protein
MYKTMVCCKTASTSADQSDGVRDFGELWRVAEKVVYSPTADDEREDADRARVRLRQVRRLKETAAADITAGGAELAGQAIAAGS